MVLALRSSLTKPPCFILDILPSLTPCFSLQVSICSCRSRPPRLSVLWLCSSFTFMFAISFFFFHPSLSFMLLLTYPWSQFCHYFKDRATGSYVMSFFISSTFKVTSNLKLKLFSKITTLNWMSLNILYSLMFTIINPNIWFIFCRIWLL